MLCDLRPISVCSRDHEYFSDYDDDSMWHFWSLDPSWDNVWPAWCNSLGEATGTTCMSISDNECE